MWLYAQISGRLSHPSIPIVATGYSGKGEARNRPGMEAWHNLGPIPRGCYDIRPPHDTASHGPFVLGLTPDAANEMYGRTGMLIHGDDKDHDASEGCIILPRFVREAIWNSPDHRLQVV